MTMNDTRGLWRGKTKPKCNGEEFNEVWVEGDLIHSENRYYIHPVANAVKVQSELGKLIIMHEVEPTTLGECTGLRDKNGKFIFEGDILMGDIPEDLPNNRNLIGVVRYERTAYMVDFSHSREKWKIQRVGFCSFSNFEVIGNIHDGGVKCD